MDRELQGLFTTEGTELHRGRAPVVSSERKENRISFNKKQTATTLGPRFRGGDGQSSSSVSSVSSVVNAVSVFSVLSVFSLFSVFSVLLSVFSVFAPQTVSV